MLRCPIYNSTNACEAHNDCLFLRNTGCALVYAATLGESNQNLLKTLETKINYLDHKLDLIIAKLNSAEWPK